MVPVLKARSRQCVAEREVPAATIAEMKEKGAVQLSADDLKSLLTGATLRYEGRDSQTQMKLNANGSVAGSAQRRIGSERAAFFEGEWRISDDGQWCGMFRSRGADGAKYCRTVFKLGDTYYWAEGRRDNDARNMYRMSVSK